MLWRQYRGSGDYVGSLGFDLCSRFCRISHAQELQPKAQTAKDTSTFGIRS